MCQQSDLTMRDCRVLHSSATIQGGGVHFTGDGASVIVDSFFQNNSVAYTPVTCVSVTMGNTGDPYYVNGWEEVNLYIVLEELYEESALDDPHSVENITVRELGGTTSSSDPDIVDIVCLERKSYKFFVPWDSDSW